MTALSRAQTHKAPELWQDYACIMTRWHQNASRVAGHLLGESTDDRWFPNIGPIMLNFDVSCVVNRNKLLRNSRIVGDIRHRDSCNATVLGVPPGRSPTKKRSMPSADLELICNVTLVCVELCFVHQIILKIQTRNTFAKVMCKMSVILSRLQWVRVSLLNYMMWERSNCEHFAESLWVSSWLSCTCIFWFQDI